MKFTIFAPDFKITPSIRRYLGNKTKKLDKYFSSSKSAGEKEKDTEVEIRIKIEETNTYHRKGRRGKRTSKEGRFKVELDLLSPKQKIVSSACGSNLYRVINKAYKKLWREEKQQRSRRYSLLKRGSQAWKDLKNRTFQK